MKKIYNSANSIYFHKDHDMVRRAVSDFVKKEINPHVDQWEEDGIAPLKDIFKKMGDLGFLGIRYDPQYGGQGLDYWYDTVFMKEAGLDATREVSMGKLIASKVLIKVADGCLQMYGGLGFMNEMLISRYYRDARGLAIGGGADEVMSDVIAKLEGY